MKKRALTIILSLLVLALCVTFFLVTCNRYEDETETTAKSYTVSFTTYTDDKIASQTVKSGAYATEPTLPARAGYTFDGWYNGKVKWDFAKYKVTGDLELTAKWTKYLAFGEAKDSSGGIWVTGCQFNVENVIIPDTYNGKPVTGIHFAFASRKNIKSIVIPDTVTYIGEGSFSGCTSLESIFIPDSVTILQAGAFENCDSLTEIRCESPEIPSTWNPRFNKTDAVVKYGAKE